MDILIVEDDERMAGGPTVAGTRLSNPYLDAHRQGRVQGHRHRPRYRGRRLSDETILLRGASGARSCRRPTRSYIETGDSRSRGPEARCRIAPGVAWYAEVESHAQGVPDPGASDAPRRQGLVSRRDHRGGLGA